MTRLVPAEDREMILASYSGTWGGNWTNLAYRPDDKDVQRTRSASHLLDVLGEDADQRQTMSMLLIDILRIVGRGAEARDMANELLKRDDLIPRYRVEIVRDLAWMLIEEGRSAQALEELDHWIAAGGDGLPTSLLLVDRARVKATLEKWSEAEKEMEAFFARAPREKLDYSEYADACLVHGFLRDHRGDHAGARETWSRGFLRDWPGQLPMLIPGHPLLRGLTSRQRAEAVMFNGCLLSLTGETTEADAERQFNDIISADVVAGRRLSPIFRFATKRFIPNSLIRAIMEKTCTTPRGREFARKLALRQVSLRDYIVEPLRLNLDAAVHVSAIDREFSFRPDSPSPETDRLVWEAVRGLTAAYDNRQLSDVDVTQIGLSWLGLVDPATTWKALSSHVGAGLSPLIAYGFGRRCLKLAKDQSAVAFFREVVGALPPEHHTSRLARAELEHLQTSASGR